MRFNETEFQNIQDEYTGGTGIFSEDTKLITILKELPLHDQRILILYAELCSVRKVARLFNCSSSLIHQKIKNIRKYFEKRLDGNGNKPVFYNSNDLFYN